VNRRQINAEAKIQAGVLLESVLAEGWAGRAAVIERFGKKAAEAIEQEMYELAGRLVRTQKPQ
jgi:hypothetical protein